VPRLGGGVHPDDGFDQSSRGRVGGGQVGGGERGRGRRRESLIEAVNHRGSQDRGCVSAQSCTGVITIPSLLASRYMRLFPTADLALQPFAIFEIV